MNFICLRHKYHSSVCTIVRKLLLTSTSNYTTNFVQQ